jgi:hypothetical protein
MPREKNSEENRQRGNHIPNRHFARGINLGQRPYSEENIDEQNGNYKEMPEREPSSVIVETLYIFGHCGSPVRDSGEASDAG